MHREEVNIRPEPKLEPKPEPEQPKEPEDEVKGGSDWNPLDNGWAG